MLLGIGPILSEAIKARAKLKDMGVEIGIASVGTVKPLDEDFLIKKINEGYSHWITLEEHHKNGGLGSSLLEWMNAKHLKDIKLDRIGIEDAFIHELGTQMYVRRTQGIDAEGIAETIARILR